ncbi:MAG: succinate dehydrogenase, hydrophobic membrane anchor protein [Rickettsiaceae bacterium]|nr:succinate dehydrogenase, hydrophobic membrane anchor protein [Rickettsiaceae bacterium]
MNNYSSLKSGVAKARNLGSSGHGSGHWIMQRLSALLLIPLFIWFVYFMYVVVHTEEEDIANILQMPKNFAPLLLLITASLYHSMLGMQVVIEDYISCLCTRNFLIIGLKLFTFVTIFFLSIAIIYFCL